MEMLRGGISCACCFLALLNNDLLLLLLLLLPAAFFCADGNGLLADSLVPKARFLEGVLPPPPPGVVIVVARCHNEIVQMSMEKRENGLNEYEYAKVYGKKRWSTSNSNILPKKLTVEAMLVPLRERSISSTLNTIYSYRRKNYHWQFAEERILFSK